MFVVLGAAGVGLALAVLGTFVARANLLEAGAWVRHTAEVELAIADCRIHLRDAGLIRAAGLIDGERSRSLATAAAERVQRLTSDNPAQQVRVAALLARLHGYGGDAGAAESIDGALRELTAVEASLMDVRSAVLARATRAGWLILGVSAALTFLLVGTFVAMLLRQARSLSRARVEVGRKGALLESVFDTITDGIMAITPDRKVLHFNRAARQLLGDRFPVDSFLGDWRSVLECVYEDGRPMWSLKKRALGGALDRKGENTVISAPPRRTICPRPKTPELGSPPRAVRCAT